MPANISQLVANNLTMVSTPHQNKEQSKVNWCNLILLTLVFTGVNNCYWITIYNVTYLDGNKFVNGIILGVAELASGIFCGLLISFTSPKLAF